MNESLRGLYVITDRQLSLARNMPLFDMVAQAIAGGARIVQYRDKQENDYSRQHEARELAKLCRRHAVTFLVNDDVDLAIEIDADGVHLGQTDLPLQIARDKLGKHKFIGITCHNDIEYALNAQTMGADYVAFGRFFPSQSKPTATPCSLDTLQQARQVLQIPIAAIGGVTAFNGKQLIGHGADMLAVIHAVFGAREISSAAKRFSQLFA